MSKNPFDAVEGQETGGTSFKWSDKNKEPIVGATLECIIVSHKETPNAKGGAGAVSQKYQYFSKDGPGFFYAPVALHGAIQDNNLIGKIVQIEVLGSHKSNAGNDVIDFKTKSLENTAANRKLVGLNAFGGKSADEGEDEDEDEI